MLMGILSTSLTPYNNDLYTSNLAHIPVLAVHGAEDDNVPPRHSREHVALIQAWDRHCAERKLVEVPAKGHWWDDVLKLPEVYEFIDRLTRVKGQNRPWIEDRRRGFTLTTANPDESGSRSGIRISELRVPGRLARLDVKLGDVGGGEKLDLRGTNVKRITFQDSREGTSTPTLLRLDSATRQWEDEGSITTEPHRVRRYGPMIRLLASSGPIVVVANPAHATAWSIAQRYAHDLYLYHRLSVDIVPDLKAIDRYSRPGRKDDGNLVVIGTPTDNCFARWLLSLRARPFAFEPHGGITFGGREVDERGAGESLTISTGCHLDAGHRPHYASPAPYFLDWPRCVSGRRWR